MENQSGFKCIADSFKWQNFEILSREDGNVSKSLNSIMAKSTNICKSEAATVSVGYVDAWDNEHVKMPCSPFNLYYENHLSVQRWSIIKKALSAPIDSLVHFSDAVRSYNGRRATSWNDRLLSGALKTCPEYKSLLQKIACLALQLPQLVTQPIPLLTQNEEGSITISRLQIACLLANAFFSTFPLRTATGQRSEYASFPTINFATLFSARGRRESSGVQKILCLLHYFSRMLVDGGDTPKGAVTFVRRCLDNVPDFGSSCLPIGSIAFGVSTTCLIEDARGDTMHVDFANRFIGGGVLGQGCVQEEILCCIFPEMLVARLFSECLLDNEAILVVGAERFSRYTGYADSFKWVGDYNEAQEGNSRDAEDRWRNVTTVINATRFRNSHAQFLTHFLNREAYKAYIGFTDAAAPYYRLPPTVVSGHWGCGAYRGNKILKALIQILVCAQASKSLAYCSFGEVEFTENITKLYAELVENKCTVGRLWNILHDLDPPKSLKENQISDYVINKVLESIGSVA